MAERMTQTDDLDLMLRGMRLDTAPSALTDRIVADALRVQAQAVPSTPDRTGAGSVWWQMVRLLGGWPALGGMAVACAAGVWIGFAAPALDPTGFSLFGSGADDIEMIDGYGVAALLAEEI